MYVNEVLVHTKFYCKFVLVFKNCLRYRVGDLTVFGDNWPILFLCLNIDTELKLYKKNCFDILIVSLTDICNK